MKIIPLVLAVSSAFGANALSVTNIAAVHHDGQTFITWTDPASGAAGANYRYKLYRSLSAITNASSLAAATLIQDGVSNNSGQMVGQFPYSQTTRQDSAKRMSIIQQGTCPGNAVCGTALSAFTGLAVHTATANESAYYAVMTHDRTAALTDSPVSAGSNATTSPVVETVAPIKPLKYFDSNDNTNRGPSTSTGITGAANLPLWVSLHGAGGCNAQLAFGDYWQYWWDNTGSWGGKPYQEGVQNVFSVQQTHSSATWGTPAIQINPCGEIWDPAYMASASIQSYYWGYLALPLGSADPVARANAGLEPQWTWLTNWATSQFATNPLKTYAYGFSMGAQGMVQWAIRHPELFAAVFPTAADWHPSRMATLSTAAGTILTTQTLPDGTTQFLPALDAITYVQSTCGTSPYIPPIIYGAERQDTSEASWAKQIEMHNALKACHMGYAWSWGNTAHSSAGINQVLPYYDAAYTKGVSYPAFTSSSIDNNIGNGSTTDGDLTGCVNCGFFWSNVSESSTTWTASVSNSLNKTAMTVDITPRNAQRFLLTPGRCVSWSASTGTTGTAVADAYGLATAVGVTMNPGMPTTITFTVVP